MSEFQKDHTPFDTIETKIHQHLWNIGNELNKLNSLVDRFFALGVPDSSRRTLQDEIQTVFGAADLSSIIDVTEAVSATMKAAKTAAKSEAA